MCFLSNKLTTKDQQLKTQMMMPFKDDEAKKLKKCGWKMGFLMNKEVI